MKRIFLSLLVVFSLQQIFCEPYLGICSLLNKDDKNATFESAGASTKRNMVEANAIQSLFYSLFYTGIEGINDDKPLIQKENKTYTNGFFNEQAKYSFYVVQSEPQDKITKIGNELHATYTITIRLSKLIADLKMNKVYYDSSNPKQMSASDVSNASGMVLPSIIVVPYKKPGEGSYADILANDYDRRVAVSTVQQGFQDINVKTIDLQSKINAANRVAQFDKNANAGQGNDRMLLQTSGADVFVEVDIEKDIDASGSRVNLMLKAYETATGNLLANEVATTNRRYKSVSSDVLCQYTVKDNLDSFLKKILKEFAPANGTKVSLSVSIDGNSSVTFNTPMGTHNYSLRNIITQWVRKNAYEGKYQSPNIVDEFMHFDYIAIPPVDQDGLKMDASQFSFYLEQYLKETEKINCSVRLEGNKIMVIIYD
ncbi:MAG: hypothetical protein IJ834_05455 [Paludibacteraceae bacterium]|nr:hypothetical protein [Paludibacteraceae bacterium]